MVPGEQEQVHARQLNRLAIVGVPGTGTTSVGRLVAERLQLGFLDLEDVLRRRGVATDSIVVTQETTYLHAAADAAVWCLGQDHTVVALGSIAAHEDVRAALPTRATVLLSARARTLATRLGFDQPGAPALPGLRAALIRRAAAATAAMAELASMRVATDDALPTQVADVIVETLSGANAPGG